MNWYFSIRGGYTHVRVFMNGGKCGALCFRNDEFDKIVEVYTREHNTAELLGAWKDKALINFIPEDKPAHSSV